MKNKTNSKFAIHLRCPGADNSVKHVLLAKGFYILYKMAQLRFLMEKKVTQENILVSNYPSRRPNLEMLSPAYINKSDLLTMTQNDFLRFWRLGAGLAGILIRILTTPNLDTRTLVIDLRPRPSINRFISLFISDCCG